MPFRFIKKESLANAIRRLCRRRVAAAQNCLRHSGRADGIHNVRKEIKKLNAVLKLVRDDLGKGRRRKLRKRLQGMAKEFSIVRDAQVMSSAFMKLTRPQKLPAIAFLEIKSGLRENLKQMERKFAESKRVAVIARELRKLKKDFRTLKPKSDDWTAIGRGLERSFRRGQNALETIRADPSPRRFHQWRKRVKDLWLQMRLIREASSKRLRTMTDELKTLGEWLGDDHDLFLLTEFIARNLKRSENADRLIGLAGKRQKELRTAALDSGARIYSEAPKQFCRRIGKRWKNWRGK
ncbi:MAG TPA: CHAD domain-containing protein [Verrucomicrobiae bacterium]|nr:CHAD domain-containing protein [Verrucomicrobiae bacterium]